MIFSKRLARRAHQKVIYVETQAEKDRFLRLVEAHKLKRQKVALTAEEKNDIINRINKPDNKAGCFERNWFKPVVLFYSRNISVGDLFWRHDLVHYQLRRYRRLNGPAAGGRLILHFLSLNSFKNLAVFYRVTHGRYREILQRGTDEAALEFLEEMLICSVADYQIEKIMREDFKKLNKKAHSTYLKKLATVLENKRLKDLPTFTLGVRFWILKFIAGFYNKNLGTLLKWAHKNPGARW